MKKQYPALVKSLTSNPLPDSLEVTPNKAENVDKLYDIDRPAAQAAGRRQGERRQADLAPHPRWSRTCSSGRSRSRRVVLLIASVLLIANTIRLSIFSRRREIEVMKLVGATNWFVRGPFMLEGLFCGVAGSVLAIFFLVHRQGDRAAGDPAAPEPATPTCTRWRSR